MVIKNTFVGILNKLYAQSLKNSIFNINQHGTTRFKCVAKSQNIHISTYAKKCIIVHPYSFNCQADPIEDVSNIIQVLIKHQNVKKRTTYAIDIKRVNWFLTINH